MDNTKLYDKIQEVIDSPVKNFTKEEARKILREYNIIDDNGEIMERFKGIIVRKEDTKCV